MQEKEILHGNAMLSLLIPNYSNTKIKGMLEKIPSKVIILKVLDNNKESGKISEVIEAIQYAEKMGAQICCMAFDLYEKNHELCECLGESDMMFVVPAGNDGLLLNGEFCTYPAGYNLENVLVCADVRADGVVSYTSNYGKDYVDVGVPATDIPVLLNKNVVSCVSGTSIAASIATAIASIVYTDADEELTARELKKLLVDNSKYLPKLEGMVLSNGIVNLEKTLLKN